MKVAELAYSLQCLVWIIDWLTQRAFEKYFFFLILPGGVQYTKRLIINLHLYLMNNFYMYYITWLVLLPFLTICICKIRMICFIRYIKGYNPILQNIYVYE